MGRVLNLGSSLTATLLPCAQLGMCGLCELLALPSPRISASVLWTAVNVRLLSCEGSGEMMLPLSC